MTAQHVAIIMDGNGRWAEQRGLPRAVGHERGAEAVRRTVRAARELHLPALTLYAFSTQNWGRPALEVSHLMALLRTFLLGEREELMRNGVRLRTIGLTETLPMGVRTALEELMAATAANRQLTLCLALSYGGREDILRATRKLAEEAATGRVAPNTITEATFAAALSTRDLPPVDLVIRTSGEQRLSNFLLWESAYAELHFTERLWPDFGRSDLEEGLRAFSHRQRRFGLVAPMAVKATAR